MNHHAEGMTHRLTGVTSDLEVAKINVGPEGAVLRVRTDRAYSNAEISRFSEKLNTNRLPEREYLIPGVVDIGSMDILDSQTGQYVPLSSPQGRSIAQSLLPPNSH